MSAAAAFLDAETPVERGKYLVENTSQLFMRWGDDGFKKFLETGLNPRGHAADPPMPQYRFSPEDAAAMLQYLKTVK